MPGDASRAPFALQYALRANFYLQKSRESRRAWTPKRLSSTEKRSLNWSDYPEMGISAAAWERVKGANADPAALFCHPELLARTPDCLGYYAHSAALSGKGIEALAREARAGRPRTRDAGLRARVVNRHISTLIEAHPDLLTQDRRTLRAMSFGAHVNGSWRNRVGQTGAQLVKQLILGHLSHGDHVASVLGRKGRAKSRTARDADEARTIVLANGYTIAFGSEPDIAIRSREGKLEVAIEVKAGLDSGGALERYGACKKSFDRAFDENSGVHTIYLSSCITKGAERAINRDRLVREVHDLGQVLSDATTRQAFLDRLTWLLHL